MSEKDILNIYSRYYGKENRALLATVLTHSRAVARKALFIARSLKKKGIETDEDFIYSASMLHDIGIINCNAPSIGCFGDKPYICHGIEGAAMMRKEGLEKYARVCERHTGAGLTAKEIIEAGLPLPNKDLLPETTEEKIICYADKFFSKSGEQGKEKELKKIISQLQKHGQPVVERFLKLHNELG